MAPYILLFLLIIGISAYTLISKHIKKMRIKSICSIPRINGEPCSVRSRSTNDILIDFTITNSNFTVARLRIDQSLATILEGQREKSLEIRDTNPKMYSNVFGDDFTQPSWCTSIRTAIPNGINFVIKPLGKIARNFSGLSSDATFHDNFSQDHVVLTDNVGLIQQLLTDDVRAAITEAADTTIRANFGSLLLYKHGQTLGKHEVQSLLDIAAKIQQNISR